MTSRSVASDIALGPSFGGSIVSIEVVEVCSLICAREAGTDGRHRTCLLWEVIPKDAQGRHSRADDDMAC